MRKLITFLSVLTIFALSLTVIAVPLFDSVTPVSVAESPPNSVNSLTSSSGAALTNSMQPSSQGATFYDPQVSSTVINQNAQIGLTWSDPSGILGYIFSYNLGSGGFVNDSYVSITNSTKTSTTSTITIPGTQGERVQWMFYVNDGNGAWSKSYVYAFIAGNSPSDISVQHAALVTDNAYDLLAYDGTYLVNLGNFPQLMVTNGDTVGFNQVKWNSQDTMALAVGYNNSVVLYSRTTGIALTLSTGVSMDTNLKGLTWTPNGTSAVITGSNPDVILTYSPVTGQFTQLRNPTGVSGLGEVAWNTIYNYALIAGSNGLIKFSGETGRLNPIPSASGIDFNGISFNPNGTMALLTSGNGTLYKYSTETSSITEVATLSDNIELQHVAFSRDGVYALITASSASTGYLYKFNGQAMYQIGNSSNSVANGISFASDDSYAIVTMKSGNILRENYNQNSTSIAALAPNTSLVGIDFPPQTPTVSTITSSTSSSSSSSSLGTISIQANTGQHAVGTPISLSGITLTSGGSSMASQMVYLWVNGQNLGSTASNSTGYWSFSFTPNSTGSYYAVASQNQDGSGVTSTQLALSVLSATSTSTVSTSITTTTITPSSTTSSANSSTTSTTSSSSNSTTNTNSSASLTTSQTKQSNSQNFASLFEFVPFLTSSSHTPLQTAVFTLEVIAIIAFPFILAMVAKKEKKQAGDGSRKWRW